MAMLLFVFRSRINQLFSYRYAEWMKMIPAIFFLIISAINGVIFAGLIDANRVIFSNDHVHTKDLIYLSIVFFIPVFNFIPGYQKRIDIVPRFYPVSPLKRRIMGTLVELMSVSIMGLSAFLISVFFSSKVFSFGELVFSFLLVLFSVGFTRAVKGAVESEGVGRELLLIMGILGTSVMAILIHNVFIGALLILILAYSSGLVEGILETKKRPYPVGQMFHHSVVLYPFHTSNVRVALLVAFFIKGALFVFAFNTSDELSVFMRLLLISPLIIFTYVYNNSWGFFRGVWHQTQIRTSSIRDRIKLYVGLLIGPLLVDLTLTFVFLLSFRQFELFHVYTYCTSLINMAVVGFIVSMTNPVNVREGINPFGMKASTSGLGIASDFLLVIVSWLPNWYPQFSWIMPASSFLLIAFSYYFITTNYSYKVHKIFNKI